MPECRRGSRGGWGRRASRIRRSCDQPPLTLRVVYAAAGGLEVSGVTLNSNELAPHAQRRITRGAATHERIEHQRIRFRARLERVRQQRYRLFARVTPWVWRGRVERPDVRPLIL